MQPAAILKSMYPEKFAELAAIVRGFAPDASDDALDSAAGELLVGLGQCSSEADAVHFTAKVFRDVLAIKLAHAESELAGADIYNWRRGWTDTLY